MLTKNRSSVIEERSKLTLTEINEDEYSDFEKGIIPFIVNIGEQALKELNQVRS